MTIFQALERLVGTTGAEINLTSFIVIFGLAFARLLVAISFSPFMGGNAVPSRIKVGLAVVVTAVVYPEISTISPLDNFDSAYIVALVLKEILIGMVIGYVSQMVFYAVQMAGTIIDTQRGMNQMTFVAPQLPGNVSLLGQIKFQAAIALFLTLNGHLIFLNGISNSFEKLPVTTFPPFRSGLTGVVDQIIRVSADVVIIGLQLSAPVLIALFLIDVSFAAIGKVAPQINVHSESQPVKSLVGLAVFLLAIGLVFNRLEYFFAVMLRTITAVISGLA